MAEPTLTELQRTVLELFFTLPESEGFVLAGGAALVALGLSDRPTKDIDLFGADLALGISPASDALEAACVERGWTIERKRDTTTFRRLVVRRDPDELLVDLAVDSPPLGTPTITAVGPTYPPEELAARKVLALFDRAEPRSPLAAVTATCLGHLARLHGSLRNSRRVLET
ncbi:MAG: nucleotidyl transferase AbiEii/AbiGii toxin family protein, partial [Acidimicrobiales bacterium]